MHTKPTDLNEAQWQAVCHKGPHTLILAGPGTGKTHTLIHRMARTIPNLKPGEKVLAIIFTNKAAQQLKDRLLGLGVPQSQTFIGTFHAFALRLLRNYWVYTPLTKDFKVASPQDLEGFDKAVLERVSLLKSTTLAILPDDEYKDYQKALRQKGLIDFDDILREALDVLDNEGVLAEVRSAYKYIFVDEYQDINIIQHALLKRIAGETGSVTAIGDPNQSIYGFRGSQVQLFHSFVQDFKGASVLLLNENYRSTPNLLEASCQVIRSQSDNNFSLIANLHNEGRLVIHQAETDRSEADYIAAQIEKIIGGFDMRSALGTNRTFGDIAILYRLNSQRHVIIQALEHLGIPYKAAAKTLTVNEYSDEAALGQYEEAIDYSVEKVSLMSIHASKGLEFPVVFLTGCEEKLIPLDLNGMTSDPFEERRLFYVGMTRAREALYLTAASRRQLYGKTMTNEPSQFLSDIEEKLKEHEAGRKLKKKVAAADDGQMKLF
jgi:DNA helicase II / ATP-dependent DNA helicase PcrA